MRTEAGRWTRWAAVLFSAVAAGTRVVGVLAPSEHPRAVSAVGLGALALALVCLLRVVRARRPEAEVAGEAVRRLARLEQVVSVPFQAVSLDELLPEMAARLQRTLDADFAAVLLVEDEALTLRVVAGSLQGSPVGTTIPFGAGLVGRVASDGVARTRKAVYGLPGALPLLHREMPSAAAAAMVVNGTVTGVVAVGSRRPDRHEEGELPLLDYAAERLAGAVEAARLGDAERRASLGAGHARRHLRLLGDASRILMQSVDDYEGPLVQIVTNAVGGFASLAAVYVAEGEQGQDADIRPLVARMQGRPREVALPQAAIRRIRDTMANGQSQLVIFDDPADVALPDQPLAEALGALGMHSYVVAPIQVRGLSFGALLFATGPEMRGYRPSDRAALDELSQRIALAAEASLLYREATANAATTSGHLLRLRGLLDVWLDIAAAQERDAILREAASGAARLLTPARVTVVSHDEQYVAPPSSRKERLSVQFLALLERHDEVIGSRDVSGDAPTPVDSDEAGTRWLAAPMALGDGTLGWIVAVSNEGVFTDEDESLLVLLTRVVAIRLANAELYQDRQEAAARLEALFEASPAGIVTLTPELTPADWNPAAAALFGWSAAPADSTALPGELVGCLRELADESAGGQVDCDLRLDGATRSLVLMLSARQPDTRGGQERILVITDETERQQLAEQVQRSQRLDAIGRLSGGIAHDFNNLLTVILGYADGLLRRMDDREPHRTRVEAIHRAGTRGAELTRQLLTISRQQAVNPVVLHPTQLADEFATTLRQILGESVDLVREQGGEELKVRIDRPQLEQILLNVASNARDAMPDGGRLTISVTGRTPHDVGGPPADAGRSWVAIAATDTGTGMNSETLARCLEPLFTTKQPGMGTGLGLATAHGIAAQNRGDLRVTSTPGNGTTVLLLLPAVTDDVTAPAEDSLPFPRDRAEIGSGTIMLVDDDADVRAMVERILRERGFHVVPAASGADALAAMAEGFGDIDLLLTDVAMPGMGGAELAQVVQALRPVPVLYISGYAERLGTDEVRDDLLAKPFTPDELIAAVSAALARDAAPGRQGSKR